MDEGESQQLGCQKKFVKAYSTRKGSATFAASFPTGPSGKLFCAVHIVLHCPLFNGIFTPSNKYEPS
jgi:hypothetical protein